MQGFHVCSARECNLAWEGSCSRNNGSRKWISTTKMGPFKVLGELNPQIYRAGMMVGLKVEGSSCWDIGFWFRSGLGLGFRALGV